METATPTPEWTAPRPRVIDVALKRRPSEASIRYADRKRREDEAPRLAELFQNLQSLGLEVTERRGGAPLAEAGYIRRIVVEHAPALFLLPCGDPSCRDGGHDVTHAVLSGLRTGAARFEGHDACSGTIGTSQCSRELHWVATATWRG